MNPAKKMEFQSQSYQIFWPAVLLSERAEAKSKELEILYDGYTRSLQATLVGVLNEAKHSRSKNKIQVVELMQDQKMPPGIKLSYRIEAQNLYICDIWLPIQPTLF